VSLQGSLQTMPVADMLGLLTSTGKTGEFRVDGAPVDTRLCLRDGELVASTSGRNLNHADAVFELVRLVEGTFVFEPGLEPSVAGEASPLHPLLEEARRRLVEWREIEKVVPSLDVVVRPVEEAPGPEIVLRPEQWRMLVAAGGGRTVHDLLDHLSLAEFDGCRAIKDLVDQGFVTIGRSVPPAVARPEPPAPAGDAPDSPWPAAEAMLDEAPPAPAETAESPSATEEPVAGEPEPVVADWAFWSQSASPGSPGDGPVRGEGEDNNGGAAVTVEASRPKREDEDMPHVSPQTVDTGVPEAEVTDEGSHGDDKAISRGLLLKFLSSVRS
jgi:uncharacterized protein DUF4388